MAGSPHATKPRPITEKLEQIGPDMTDEVQIVAKSIYDNKMLEAGFDGGAKRWEDLGPRDRWSYEVLAREFLAAFKAIAGIMNRTAEQDAA